MHSLSLAGGCIGNMPKRAYAKACKALNPELMQLAPDSQILSEWNGKP
jgi:hypothetical protein